MKDWITKGQEYTNISKRKSIQKTKQHGFGIDNGNGSWSKQGFCLFIIKQPSVVLYFWDIPTLDSVSCSHFFPWSKHKNNAVSRREHLALGHSQRGLAGTVLSMYILMWYAGFTVHSKSLSGSRCSLKSVELLDTEPPQGHGFIFSMKACQQGSIAGSLVNYVYTLITSHCPSHELPLNTKRKRANGFFNSEGLISAHPWRYVTCVYVTLPSTVLSHAVTLRLLADFPRTSALSDTPRSKWLVINTICSANTMLFHGWYLPGLNATLQAIHNEGVRTCRYNGLNM